MIAVNAKGAAEVLAVLYYDGPVLWGQWPETLAALEAAGVVKKVDGHAVLTDYGASLFETDAAGKGAGE